MCLGCAVDGFPDMYNGSAFIAEHGSWAREKPIGYRVATVSFFPNGSVADHQVFVEGFLQKDGQAWGESEGIQAFACAHASMTS